ncbi:MAG: radical SAM protein [Synergistaceae bacterium]|jgi:DNA repair photolyase|nr:radical SAM protein [Synergistaceae bacterium]
MVVERVISAGDYLSPSKLPGADFVINPYVGCPHKCIYCYAEFMKRFTNHDEPWGDFVDVKRCAKRISPSRVEGKNIFMSSVTDAYNPYEKKYGVSRRVLEQLSGVRCSLTITTKSFLAVRDIDLISAMPDATVALSINSVDREFSRCIEPFASSPMKRVEALKRFHDAGVATVLFVSPVFPAITDFRKLIEATSGFVDEYWFENLKLRPAYRSKVMRFVRERFPALAALYREIYDQGAPDYWIYLSEEIDSYCRNNGIPNYRKFISAYRSPR